MFDTRSGLLDNMVCRLPLKKGLDNVKILTLKDLCACFSFDIISSLMIDFSYQVQSVLWQRAKRRVGRSSSFVIKARSG